MRVIPGFLGGRGLIAPRGYATRPTTDRVREALFAVLGCVGEARVLDLFAGTGALGIEALSRGARATFVEQGRAALVALQTNVDALALGDRDVIGQSVERCVAALAKAWTSPTPRFDLVLIDPPYASLATIPGVVAVLTGSHLMAADARVVVEHASRDSAPRLGGFCAEHSRNYGDTAIAIYTRTG